MGESTEHVAQVAMPRARHPVTGEVLHATDIPSSENHWPKPLRCESCRARVHAVNTQRTEEHAARALHFARNRPSGSGSDPNPHEDNCSYNLDKLISVLVEESGGSLYRAGKGVDGSTGERRTLYRLPWPDAFTQTRNQLEAATTEDRFAEQTTRLLNTAAKIAALLERYMQLGVEPGIEFRAVCHGAEIEWLNFLYTPHRAWLVVKRVREYGPLRHPVAIIFRPTNSHHHGSRLGWVYQDMRAPKGNVPAVERIFTAGSTVLTERIFMRNHRLVRGRWYIGYGMWYLTTHTERHPPRLTLNVDENSVIAPLPEGIDEEVLRSWSVSRPLLS